MRRTWQNQSPGVRSQLTPVIGYLGEYLKDGRVFMRHRGREVTVGALNRVRCERCKLMTHLKMRSGVQD